MIAIPRNEYPRPDFVRDNWISLNGIWDFSFDTEDYNKKILVPYVYQSKLSGIDIREFHDVVWYKRIFALPEKMKNKKVYLHFGAVDYTCRVWINDIFVGEHAGGQSSFSFDITEVINSDRDNTICVKVCDETFDLEMPRGKQYWKLKSESIFYTPSTGIWQSVWLEAVSENHIKKVMMTPLLDERSVKIEYELEGSTEVELQMEIYFKGKFVTSAAMQSQSPQGCFTVLLDQPSLKGWNFTEELTWTPENPRLFDITFRLKLNKHTEDVVSSYFGMRKVSIHNGVFMLNNRSYYQRLILDQGYWEESLLTAPTDDDYIKDIMLTKQMGFNGVRKHQKVEDPRYLYHADRLGLLVWGEIGSAYIYSRKYAARITNEWLAAVVRDYNHPCIVAWTPLNESWGVQGICANQMEQAHSFAMYYLTKSLDSTRMVISNDGWEHTSSDFLTIHDYEWDEEILEKRYASLENILHSTPAGRPLYAVGRYDGQPILVTEFGGVSYCPRDKEKEEDWGYSSAENGNDLLEKYRAVITPIIKSTHIQGFCYTQLSDVEQEINGLLTYSREPKIDIDKIRKITTMRC